MANQRGVPTLPTALIKPTLPDAPALELADDQVDGDQSRGVAAEPKKPRVRKPSTASGEVKGRKLSLPDSVFDRLQLAAFQRRKTMSVVAAEILDRNLPKLRIEREG
jgi:hypothetical protein